MHLHNDPIRQGLPLSSHSFLLTLIQFFVKYVHHLPIFLLVNRLFGVFVDQLNGAWHMIGKTISHYKILSKLGEGGMGVVYKARDLKLDRDVALKFLPAQAVADEKEKTRFIHEAKSVSSLDHPNICTVHEIDETDEGQLFIAMACYEGETLKEKLEGGPLDIEEALDIALQTAQGLLKAHEKGIIHRDLKPANLFITQDHIVKILDFGLAKLRGGTKLTTTGTTLGTVSYMSPEQARGEEVDERTDIWSLGVVMYEMLTGQLPFRGEYEQAVMYSILNAEPEPMAACRKEIPAVFEQICGKALVKDRTGRFQTMNEMAGLLQRLKEGDARGLQEILKATLPKVRRQKVRRAVFIYGGALILLLAAVGISLSLRHKEAKPAWMDPEIPPEDLIGGQGHNTGCISPKGNYVLYCQLSGTDSKAGKLQIKNRVTGSNKVIHANDSSYASWYPTWSPDGTQYAVLTYTRPNTGMSKIMIGSVEDEQVHYIEIEDKSMPEFLAWSPDGMRLVYTKAIDFPQYAIVIVNKDGSNEHMYPRNGLIFHPAWSPDCRLIAFIEYADETWTTGSIKFLDVSKGTFSASVAGAIPYRFSNITGGLTWSPDGRYLVYTGRNEMGIQLFAARIDTAAYSTMGEPIQITQFKMGETPCFPSFTEDGKRLSYGLFYDNWDIYILNFNLEAKMISGPPITVAADKKWDSSPSWFPSGDRIAFLSDRSGLRELYVYDIMTGNTQKVISSQMPERCVVAHPDGQKIGFIAEGRIWTVPASGGKAVAVTPKNIRLSNQSRFIWTENGEKIIFSGEENSTAINQYSFIENRDQIISTAGSDFALSPDSHRLAVYGIPVPGDSLDRVYLSIFDLETDARKDLNQYIPIEPKGRIIWTKNGKYILHDWIDLKIFEKIFELVPADGSPPVRVKMDPEILRSDDIFVNAIDPSGKRLLINYRNVADVLLYISGIHR